MGYDYTREQMAEIINNGGSMMIDGRIVTTIDQLPGPSSFISTPEEQVKSQEELQSKIDGLNKELASVKSKDVTPKVDAKK